MNCKIDNNGNFSAECYVNNEQAIRNDLANTSETFQVIVYAQTNGNTHWDKGEKSYGSLGNNVSNGAWKKFEINLTNGESETTSFNFSDIGSNPTALNYPNGGEKWVTNQSETIQWNTNSITGSTVDIFILYDDPSNLHEFSSSLDNLLKNKTWYKFGDKISNLGNYTIDPQDLHGMGNAYVILIVGNEDGWDVSDGTIILSN